MYFYVIPNKFLQISFVINFDTMDIKILDEKGQDIFEKPLDEIRDML